MSSQKKSVEKLKQPKITTFYQGGSSFLESNGIRKKRKKEYEVCENYPSPKKAALKIPSKSPDSFSTSPQRKVSSVDFAVEDGKNNHSSFLFEDFQSDPFFLSPKKEKSKKNILTENLVVGNENGNSLIEDFGLSFDSLVRCKVLKASMSESGRFEQLLLVKDEKTSSKGMCKLRDAWTSLTLSPGDVVSIQTVKSEEGWVVDNKNGLVVLFPDVIISSTSLASSFFCLRQGIISNFYRGIDSSGSDQMLIGRLIHDLLQRCLNLKSLSNKDIEEIVTTLMQSSDYLRDFYFSNLKPCQIKNEIEAFVPRIKHFLNVYVDGSIASSGNNFKGTIEKILDIEEFIKSPNLGFQGRIDVTAAVKSDKKEKIVPLELKTGRASFSNEHRSQLILYVLLMNDLGRKVDSGLLLYLRHDVMKEVIPQRDEIRNIFLLRNKLVEFYRNFQKYSLPDPIRNIKACNRCPYLRICTTYLKGEECYQLSDSHPLKTFEIPDIKMSHVDYFVEWNKMLWLEYGDVLEERNSETSGLVLESVAKDLKVDLFRHNFKIISKVKENEFRCGSLVYVTNKTGFTVCVGRICDFSESHVSVEANKKMDDISEMYKIVYYKSSFLNSYLSNLGTFLEERFENLRQIIIEKRRPRFQEKLNKKELMEKYLPILVTLNKAQQRAVLKAVLCEDYLLIKGPPGTGKTQTIVALVKVFLVLGQRVLIAAHTHSSIDNILLRMEDVEFLRLGKLQNIHKEIRKNCYATLIENCNSIEDLELLFGRKVVASTCSGLDYDFVQKQKFDVCIIDESSQVLEPEILRPLFCCKKFILVGDEDQLPPIVQNVEAKNLGMSKSLFERLSNDVATVSLTHQYRMNSEINSLANSITYNGILECGNEEVAKATLRITNQEYFDKAEKWIKEALSCFLEKSVVFLDTSSYFKREDAQLVEDQRASIIEVNIISKLIESLKNFGINEKGIGVITPYTDQINLFKKRFRESMLNEVELNTVDQYQGRDKEVILFSCTKQNQKYKVASESDLLSDKRRLTVAVTRAKRKLILVGDAENVAKYLPFQKLLASLRENQIISLSDELKDFVGN